MSEKNNRQNNIPLIATIVVALLAIAAVIILLVMTLSKGGDEDPGPDYTGFRPSEELIEECSDNASDLIRLNYGIIKLFVTEGLPKQEEPYGNRPEDGIYTVASEEYTSLSQIEELVKSVYIESEAERILHKMEVTLADGSAAQLEIYKNRNVFGDIFLGIDERFVPNEKYSSDWSDCFVEVQPTSENTCSVTVYVNGVTADEADAHPESVLKTVMIMQNGVWRLSQMLV